MKQLFFFALRIIALSIEVLRVEESVSLSITQQFDVERMNRAIDSTSDAQQLQMLAQRLLQAWHSQRAATAWVARQRQQLG
ncbi:hypothetical protein [Synechococcus sp. PROS-U-1]|uniref:hypothetical protein n=1 Tax=Synechococcus sp. PROS-U-1 TaxID=1400866 RepID=UPI0018612DA5|nr:hypothetical protein [Synechococcus sp. PROS-U-1]QNJ04655.1 hypothetical protein SynPROSU1_03075 [Synechococcus sp. PROS-U-1]